MSVKDDYRKDNFQWDKKYLDEDWWMLMWESGKSISNIKVVDIVEYNGEG